MPEVYSSASIIPPPASLLPWPLHHTWSASCQREIQNSDLENWEFSSRLRVSSCCHHKLCKHWPQRKSPPHGRGGGTRRSQRASSSHILVSEAQCITLVPMGTCPSMLLAQGDIGAPDGQHPKPPWVATARALSNYHGGQAAFREQ